MATVMSPTFSAHPESILVEIEKSGPDPLWCGQWYISLRNYLEQIVFSTQTRTIDLISLFNASQGEPLRQFIPVHVMAQRHRVRGKTRIKNLELFWSPDGVQGLYLQLKRDGNNVLHFRTLNYFAVDKLSEMSGLPCLRTDVWPKFN
jgi:hypothetical protein